MAISTLELAFRLLVFLFVLIATPLSFVLMFRLIDFLAYDELIEAYRQRTSPMDAGELNAYFRQAAEEAAVCGVCGAANGDNFTFCHNCQERL